MFFLGDFRATHGADFQKKQPYRLATLTYSTENVVCCALLLGQPQLGAYETGGISPYLTVANISAKMGLVLCCY